MGTKAIGRTVLYRRAAKDVDSWLKRHAFLTLFLVIAGLFGLLLTLSMVKTKAPTPPQADNSLTKPAVSMLIIGLFSIAISSWLTYSINTLENTKLPIFDGLKIAGYVVTISLAAIGANIAAGAIMFRAKKTVERKRCEAKKELEEISNMINDINNKISEASSDNDKFSYINKKIELEERAQKLKGLLDDC